MNRRKCPAPRDNAKDATTRGASKTAAPERVRTPVLRDAASLERAFLTLRTGEEISRFLNDLCTPAEIAAFRERWELAQRLDHGDTYRAVAEQTGASTATVTRVARFLQHERHCGYRLVLDRLHAKKGR